MKNKTKRIGTTNLFKNIQIDQKFQSVDIILNFVGFETPGLNKKPQIYALEKYLATQIKVSLKSSIII